GNDIVFGHYRLIREKDGNKDTVWTADIGPKRGLEGAWPEYVFWDAEVENDTIYVLYRVRQYGRVDAVRKDATGHWRTVMSEVMDDRGRLSCTGKLVHAAGTLTIVFTYKDGRRETWRVLDGSLGKVEDE
ncbi:MAG: hypothetical protein U1E05_15125, partial [Patescibacteria group bacterium]|nr:hypothetical protein [Patescibacteria group bacterium]